MIIAELKELGFSSLSNFMHNGKMLPLDKALKERLLNGNWEYDDDPSALMDYDSIVALFDDSSFKSLDFDDDRYITADVARFGTDKAVIMVWYGWNVVAIKTIDRGRLTGVISLIEKLQRDHCVRSMNIIVDEDGLGGGVVDALRCRGFINNSLPVKVLRTDKEL